MKTRLLSLASAILLLVALLIPASSRASTTTILYSQDFSSATFPPAGWSGNILGSSFGWSRSTGGLNGLNGSAVATTSYSSDYLCYGSSYGPLTLSTPAVNVSAFPAGDTQFVDFDLYMPQSYYELYYAPQIGAVVDVIPNGGTSILTLKTSVATNCTFYDGSYGSATDPSGYTSSIYWMHYHLALPTGVSTQNVTFKISELYTSCYYGTWYTDDIAFDNVVITNVHYDLLNLIGPLTLTFANQPLGTQSNPQYVKFKNVGNRIYNLTNYSLGGASPNQFLITRSPATIAPGVTDSAAVVYQPTFVGSKSATLVFNTDADNNKNVSITLNGFGVAPQIGLPANLVLFAKTHTRFRQSITQSFAVTALGTVPLTIAPPPATFIGGDYPNEYTILRYPKNPIAPGSTDTFTIAFTGMIEGSTSGTLFIASNASNGTQQVPLHGVGVVPRLVINNVYNPFGNSIAMPFDSVNVGTQKMKQMSFYNPGTDTLLLLKNFLSSKDFDFSITPLSGTDTVLAPEQTKMMNVYFTPLRNGFRTATFRAATNIPVTFPVNPPLAPNTFGPDTSGFNVVLTGTGVPFGSLAITGQAMDSVEIGKQICMNDTLRNTGSASVNVTKAMLSGGDSDQFTFSGLPAFPFSINAGGSVAFNICATPKTAGSHSTLFTGIGATGDGSGIAAPFPVSVYGQKSCATAAASTPLPAVTCVCSNGDTATITVTNCGEIGTAYTASITGANAADYAIVGSAVSPVEGAGKVATYKVAYHPSARGTSVANFVVTGGPGATLALTGKGGAPNISGTATAPVTSNGSTSKPFTVTVTNSGECAWTPGTPVLPPGSAFTYTGAASEGTTSIGPGKTGTFTFTFSPTTTGNLNTSVTFPNASCTSIPAAAVTLSGSTLSVSEATAQLGYSIEQNYPNPFSHETSIAMTLPKDDMVKLTIIDQTGHVVRTVMNQRMTAGTFNVSMNADELASGTYYYQMSTSTVTLTRQMVIVK